MFKKAQNQAKVAAETVTKAVDERFLRLNIGSTYHLRLLYCPSKVRETPFINLETHRHYDPNTKTVQRVKYIEHGRKGGFGDGRGQKGKNNDRLEK